MEKVEIYTTVSLFKSKFCIITYLLLKYTIVGDKGGKRYRMSLYICNIINEVNLEFNQTIWMCLRELGFEDLKDYMDYILVLQTILLQLKCTFIHRCNK